MTCLARIPELMQRGREALKSSCPATVLELNHEVRTLYESFQGPLADLRSRFNAFDKEAVTLPSIDLRNVLHSHYARSYGLGLTIGIIINCLLISLKGGGDHLILRQEACRMSDEILQLANIVQRYRPLGALYMTICLCAAYVGVVEKDARARIRVVLADYRRDIFGPRSEFSSTHLYRTVNRLVLEDVSS